jgi:Fe-S oxidoreductase
VISPCPTCVYTFRALYAELDLAPSARVLHLTEFLESLLGNREPAKKIPGAHVFHDPCYLTRFLDKPDLPRKLLARVLEEPLREPVWTGQDATCCGGGGLVPQVLPEVAAGAAALRMEQLRATEANRIITACPGCLQRLSQAPDALPVCDLTEVFLEAL